MNEQIKEKIKEKAWAKMIAAQLGDIEIEALKEQMIGSSALALDSLEATIEKYFPASEWDVERKSVLGENEEGNPTWSLHLYIEAKPEEIVDVYEGESGIDLTPYALAATRYLEGK